MQKRTGKNEKFMRVLKALLISYVITGILLITLAMFLYKLELNEKSVSAAIVGIYVLSTMAGGVIIGKMMKNRRLFWGLGLGVLYFSLLLAITLGIYHSFHGNSNSVVSTFLLCSAGGMLGAMIS